MLLLISFTSAGFLDFLRPTGKAMDSPLDINVSVTSGAPDIYYVFSTPATGLNLGPNPTYLHINFSVSDSDGASNINNATAAVNISKSGEAVRYNSSCALVDYSGDYANFSCLVIAWWFDDDGDWNMNVNISDLNGNVASNTTETFSIDTLTGFEMSPSSITFSTLTPGTYNQTPTNYISMNNTGNDPIASGSVSINATNLIGEDNPSQALWAANFSASSLTGGKTECNITEDATALVEDDFVGITGVVLNDGNYTVNGGGNGQEDMYLCLREVGAELSQQYYSSTGAARAWTVQVA